MFVVYEGTSVYFFHGNILMTLFLRCLWFMMEPLISKSEDYNYTFFRRMIENIKQTKDAQDPDDDETNMVSVRSYFIGHM
jgi:hypothetical protein